MSKYRIVLDKDGLYMPQKYYKFSTGYATEGYENLRSVGFFTLIDAKQYIEAHKNAGKVVWESD